MNRFPDGITLRQFKDLLAAWPDADEDGAAFRLRVRLPADDPLVVEVMIANGRLSPTGLGCDLVLVPRSNVAS